MCASFNSDFRYSVQFAAILLYFRAQRTHVCVHLMESRTATVRSLSLICLGKMNSLRGQQPKHFIFHRYPFPCETNVSAYRTSISALCIYIYICIFESRDWENVNFDWETEKVRERKMKQFFMKVHCNLGAVSWPNMIYSCFYFSLWYNI